MRQYKFVHSGTILPVTDGDIFIFSFAMHTPKATLQLLLADNHMTYSVKLKAGAALVEGAFSQREPKVPQDANVVVRVDKISPNSFTTYVNGDLIATTKPSKGHRIYNVGVFEAGGIGLTIFDSGDREMAEFFAEAMRNPAPSDVQIQEMMDLKRQARDGSEGIAPTRDREKALEAREKLVAGREKEVVGREKEVAGREKEVAGREREVADREKRAIENEKALEAREKALERRDNDINGRGADGADGRS